MIKLCVAFETFRVNLYVVDVDIALLNILRACWLELWLQLQLEKWFTINSESELLIRCIVSQLKFAWKLITIESQ